MAKKPVNRRRRRLSRQLNIPLTPSGRISRSKAARAQRIQAVEDDAREIVIAARRRHFGLSKSDASSAFAGTVIGRLRLLHLSGGNGLSAEQYDAASWLLKVHNQFAWAIGSPGYIFVPKTTGGAPRTEDELARIKARLIEEYEKILAVLEDADNNFSKPIKKSVLAAVLWDQLDPVNQSSLTIGLSLLSRCELTVKCSS